MFTQVFTISVLLSLLMFSFPSGIIPLSEELPLAILLEQDCCREFRFLSLIMSLFYLHSRRIFSLDMEVYFLLG